MCLTDNVEHFAYKAGLGLNDSAVSAPADYRSYAWRDYGNRIGIWRMFDLELNDVGIYVRRHHPAPVFAEMMMDQFDEMLRLSAEQPLVCSVSLHTFLVGGSVDRVRCYTYNHMVRTCEQREWIDGLPPGSYFRSADVPGKSRGAVSTFLSREAAKPPPTAVCVRLGADLYWRPIRDDRGRLQRPHVDDTIGAITGTGFGVAGHSAGCVTGWLTHATERFVPIAVVGTPPATRPLPYVTFRRRANLRRHELNPLEVAYLEAVRFFDVCSEIDWDEALRISAARVRGQRTLRPDRLLWVTEAERWKGVARLRERMAELCAVVSGVSPPAPTGTDLELWPGRPDVLQATHLPALMLSGRNGRTVSMSQFVKDWAHWPDRRGAMCEREPFGPNRLDLVRIAATVHALCDRDGLAIPDWVWGHSWHENIRMGGRRPVSERDRRNGLAACEYHGIWFGDDHIMDYRVHGFWSRKRVA